MKTPYFSCILLAACGVATADVPKKIPETRYSSLWMNSPFTTKPPPAEAAAVANPLEDYALIGVSPIGEGKFRVTVISKKSPETRIYVETGKENEEGFAIKSVNKKKGDPLSTTVVMASGNKTGTLKFDEKLLTLAAPQAPAQNQQPGQPGQPVNPNQPQVQPAPGQPQPVAGGNVAARQPRARVVPPPTAQPANNGAGQATQGQRGNSGRDRRRP